MAVSFQSIPYQHYNEFTKKEHLPLIASTFALDGIAEGTDTKEAQQANAVLYHSAGLVSCIIGAICEFKKKDMIFIMEGSLFWRARNYMSHVKEILRELIPEYSVTFVKVEDSPLFGGAKLVT